LQLQALHPQLLVHVAVPLPLHASVVPGAHVPPPEQPDQLDQVPPLHVRVCVPVLQLPHAWDDDPLHAHWPPAHVEPAGHTLPHAPQSLPFVCSLTHVAPQSESPAGQEQPPQAQALVHVWLPGPSHACAAPGAQAPWAEHVPQADHVPAVHVRVCVPQSPQDCVALPVHSHWLALHVAPLGHACWHEPQLFASEVVSTHAPEHAV
jgi:hypothetical protein